MGMTFSRLEIDTASAPPAKPVIVVVGAAGGPSKILSPGMTSA
jgi:hypothetical protein